MAVTRPGYARSRIFLRGVVPLVGAPPTYGEEMTMTVKKCHSAFGLLGLLALLLSAQAVAQSSGLLDDRTVRDRPSIGGGTSSGTANGGMVVVKCGERLVPDSGSTGNINGQCSCASSGTGSASCACTAGGPTQTGNGVTVSALVVEAYYADPGVSMETLEAIADNAGSCLDAVMMLESSAGSRTGGSCEFSNLWYSCRL